MVQTIIVSGPLSGGQISFVTLADGSTVALDEDSEINVQLSSATRSIRLVRGQAHFTVSHDGRPFLVQAMHHEVRAVGTSFNVDIGDKLSVSLLEGAVLVAPIPTTRGWLGETAGTPDRSRSIPLTAGQKLILGPDQPATLQQFDPAEAVAWEQGYLVFDADTLAEAIERVNRYASEKLVLAASANGQEQISGVFRTGDSAAFVRAVLALYPDLKAGRDSSGRIILSPRQG